jgi:cystathionine beta-synthase
MEVKENILETIGNTPLVRINKLAQDLPCKVYGKLEYFNPGNSIKDRIGIKMIQDAEKSGKLQPGGTIIECTSGNTGMGIALAGVVKGYKCIFTTTDKQSKTKMDALRALGAEVIVCPTDVASEDPRSYYSVAEALSKSIDNSFWCNQYDNLSNREAHYLSTGPELWRQTEGKMTHLVVGLGTGGTVSGIGKYLKEQNPDVQIWGVDTYGSVYKKYFETGEFDESEIYPYITEGIGEDIIPENIDFSLLDKVVKVTDKDGAVMTRKLASEEGFLLGYSCGSAFQGLLQLKDHLKEDDLVVVIFPDHGSRYLSKVYNDDWMRDNDFLEADEQYVRDILVTKDGQRLITINSDMIASAALEIMTKYDISQAPVVEGAKIVGSITQEKILHAQGLMNDKHIQIKEIMQPPFPVVNEEISISLAKNLISNHNVAVLAKMGEGTIHILTKDDLALN